MLKQRMKLAAVLVAAALALAGCSTDAPGGDANGDTGSATDQSVIDAAKATVAEITAIPTEVTYELEPFTPEADKKIFVVTCDLAIPGCTNLLTAVQEASDTLGYEVEHCSLGNTEQQAQLCFNQAANSGADAAIIHGTGVTQAGYGYKALADAGIPVFGDYTGNTPGSDPNIISELNGETCSLQGNQIGQYLIAETEGTANVLMYYTPFFECVKQRAFELEAALEECAGCTVQLKEFALENLGQSLSNQVQADVQANPDVDYVVGGFDAVALFASTGIRAAGKSDTVLAIGQDGDEPNIALMKEGESIGADALTGFGEDGWLLVDVISRHLAGQEVPDAVSGSPWLMTQETAAEATGDAPVWLGPPNYQDAYAQAWGKTWNG